MAVAKQHDELRDRVSRLEYQFEEATSRKDPGAWTITVRRSGPSYDLVVKRWMAELDTFGFSTNVYAHTRRGALRKAKRVARSPRLSIRNPVLRVKLSVIVPTIGRPTLARALQSIKPRPDDEVIVVSTNHDARSVARSHGYSYLDYPFSDSVAGGAQERSYGIKFATGDYLVFLDDDDVMAEGGIETIHSCIAKAKPTPFLFRVTIPGGKIWSEEPSLKLGEVTGSQFVCPREPAAVWPREQSGDHPFINETVKYWGQVVYVNEVIIDVRPEQQ